MKSKLRELTKSEQLRINEVLFDITFPSLIINPNFPNPNFKQNWREMLKEFAKEAEYDPSIVDLTFDIVTNDKIKRALDWEVAITMRHNGASDRLIRYYLSRYRDDINEFFLEFEENNNKLVLEPSLSEEENKIIKKFISLLRIFFVTIEKEIDVLLNKITY